MKTAIGIVLALMSTSLFQFLVPATAHAAGAEARLDALVDRYFDDYFSHHPSEATTDGFHQYDAKFEDYSKADVDAQVKSIKGFLKDFKAVPSKGLSTDRQIDLQLVLNHIQARNHELTRVKFWQRNPDIYSSGVSASIFGLMSRTFAPPADRLRSVIAREKLVPGVFAAARANLKNPPKIYTEVALEQIPGIVSFFQDDVPTAFKDVKDETLLAEFKAANQKVIEELGVYEKYLKENVLPRSKGDFRLGAENFRRKLLFEEMVDTPLPELLKVAYDNLHKNQKWLAETAAKIDPKRTPREVLGDLVKDHPTGDKLLDAFRDTFDGLISFIEDHHIVTIPSKVKPILEETPAFERALTFASMDTPGPYETVAKEAYFNVTLPEKGWPADRTEEHLQGFNRGTILSTAIHEAYPGHYIQFLWVQVITSKVRKLIGCNTNVEGWAHYTEQMMLDEGVSTDPKMRLGQLQDALLRNARFVVSIEMHTGKMTYEQAIDFFVNEGYQSRANGERETKRGTSDPTYLYYTLGKLQIMKLREDYKKLKGDAFSLQEFHDTFLKQGFPPIKLVRRALIGHDGPLL